MGRVAVLGAGGTGQAIAADLALAGFEVCLYESPRFQERISEIRNRGGITIRGAGRQGFAKLHKVTTDAEEVFEGASLIFVATVATRHLEMARVCATYSRRGQTIVITPGNAGSLVLGEELEPREAEDRPLIVEVEGNLYPCRLTGPGEVLVALPSRTRYIAAFPAQDTEEAIKRLKGLYDVRPATNVLETALNNPNVVIHLAASILNVGAIDQSDGSYFLYRQGLTPSVLRCIAAVQGEKKAILLALGCADRSRLDFVRTLANEREFPELTLFRGLIGPTSIGHRYISEDASTGVSLMISLGLLTKTPTPVSRALVSLASAINQSDYLQSGRTLENLGLGSLTIASLSHFLETGRK